MCLADIEVSELVATLEKRGKMIKQEVRAVKAEVKLFTKDWMDGEHVV